MKHRESIYIRALRGEVTITDGKGRPYNPPEQQPDEPWWAYLRRVYAWKDKIQCDNARVMERELKRLLRQDDAPEPQPSRGGHRPLRGSKRKKNDHAKT